MSSLITIMIVLANVEEKKKEKLDCIEKKEFL